MPAMTDEQAERAMRILAELYAEQNGITRPEVRVERKKANEKNDKVR